MIKSLNYSNVYLKPKYSSLSSRKEADISVEFLGRKYANPIIPANMASVINEDLCKWLAFNNYFYIYHRFGDTRKFLQRTRAESWPLVSISVGVKNEDKELIQDLVDSKCRVHIITIDIAHGDSILMKEMIGFIRNKLGDSVKIIGGNVATPEAVMNLSSWGADAAKVGIAGGGACSTKNTTGFHVPMFSCVKECIEHGYMVNNEFGGIDNYVYEKSLIPIIADGGTKEHGDIAKALVAGATMVMAGGLFAACIDAPGESIWNIPESKLEKYRGIERKVISKKYYGSASALNKSKTGQKVEHIEGFELEIPCNGRTYAEEYQRINEDLASSVSYAGGSNLQALKKVDYVVVK